MANKKNKKQPKLKVASQSQVESPGLGISTEPPTSQQLQPVPRTAKPTAPNAGLRTMPDDDAALTVAQVLSSWHTRQSDSNIPPEHVPSPHGSAPDIEESSSESAEEGVESIGDAHEATCGDADEDESEGLTADPFMDRIFEEVMALRKAKAGRNSTLIPLSGDVSGYSLL
ncbi:hypothetical protein PISMIDRAFT_22130 [Pisolithus microcarpus 441]|uniref:Uncharacterized protein n=1 Tax=Pisolithus microcarpus 441 TaxID=765257 RepID=A0A0C9ZE18_9AGAM|nr:hypothetical protein PISMIDRAFT_22130 [Pisolithus microcarpus 441]